MTDTGREPYSVLSIEQAGHVATLFLDRPEKRNAMGMPFFAELPRAMGELGADRSVRAIVIAARGPHFSVGLDLTSLAGIGAPSAGSQSGADQSAAEVGRRTHRDVLRLQQAISAAADCPKPVIAAVHGYCIGGGVDLITSCDIRVCSADALFSVRETKMAIVADIGSLARLPTVLTMGHVAELVYTGKDIDAARAAEIGLVNHVYEDHAAMLEGAQLIASEIAANSPIAVEGSKAVLAEVHRAQIEAGQRYVAAWNAGQLRSHDLNEAVTAFFERRPPSFEGR
jgi:enoyl-CoA hydratase